MMSKPFKISQAYRDDGGGRRVATGGSITRYMIPPEIMQDVGGSNLDDAKRLKAEQDEALLRTFFLDDGGERASVFISSLGYKTRGILTQIRPETTLIKGNDLPEITLLDFLRMVVMKNVNPRLLVNRYFEHGAYPQIIHPRLHELVQSLFPAYVRLQSDK